MKTKKVEKAEKPKKEVKTVVKIEPLNGRPCFGIHDQEKIDGGEAYTLIIGMGLPKAKAILRHLPELKKFVAANGR